MMTVLIILFLIVVFFISVKLGQARIKRIERDVSDAYKFKMLKEECSAPVALRAAQLRDDGHSWAEITDEELGLTQGNHTPCL